MKISFVKLFFLLLLANGIVSCGKRENENKTTVAPQVFTPAPEPEHKTDPDSMPVPPSENKTSPQPTADRKPLPTLAELKKITPQQEAKRSLNNDAMKAFSMKPEAFASYMQSRIPYYRGKGDLQTANDVVKIEINATQMIVETAKGRQVFPMN